jgi:hypothetical protein
MFNDPDNRGVPLRERRLSVRRNTAIAAHIAFNGGRSQMPCIIRDLSEGGARLEVSSVRDIPPTFDLLLPGHRPAACRVAWRAMKEVGISFVKS